MGHEEHLPFQENLILVFFSLAQQTPGWYLPWELEALQMMTAVPGGQTWGSLSQLQQLFTKILKCITQKRKEEVLDKNSFFFFWLSITSGLTCPKPQKVDGSVRFLLDWPLGFHRTITRIHSMTQKAFFSLWHMFPTVLHVLELLYL